MFNLNQILKSPLRKIRTAGSVRSLHLLERRSSLLDEENTLLKIIHKEEKAMKTFLVASILIAASLHSYAEETVFPLMKCELDGRTIYVSIDSGLDALPKYQLNNVPENMTVKVSNETVYLNDKPMSCNETKK